MPYLFVSFVILSAIGVAGNLLVHVLVCVGNRPLNMDAFVSVNACLMLPLLIPAILVGIYATGSLIPMADPWKAVLRKCPAWIAVCDPLFIVYLLFMSVFAPLANANLRQIPAAVMTAVLAFCYFRWSALFYAVFCTELAVWTDSEVHDLENWQEYDPEDDIYNLRIWHEYQPDDDVYDLESRHEYKPEDDVCNIGSRHEYQPDIDPVILDTSVFGKTAEFPESGFPPYEDAGNNRTNPEEDESSGDFFRNTFSGIFGGYTESGLLRLYPEEYIEYFRILDMVPGDSLADLKRAYYREISRYHPDKVIFLEKKYRDFAEDRAKQINIAYEALLEICRANSGIL